MWYKCNICENEHSFNMTMEYTVLIFQHSKVPLNVEEVDRGHAPETIVSVRCAACGSNSLTEFPDESLIS